MKAIIKSVLPVLPFCLLIICILACEDKEHQKDEKLIENFQSHKAEFNHLLQMFQEDKSLGRVAFDFTRTSNFFEKCKEPNSWNGKEIEVSNERLDEYRKLFNNLGLSTGIEGYCEKQIITFPASTKGLSVTGSSKGYAYLEKTPKTLIDNLDNYWSEDKKSFTAYRRIEGNWYLYFDYED
jgi:hypothetical protein